ncbi:MAG TPA: hypothetical protein VLK32_04735 [Bacillota bacterium]|nr:hypothetical protein [Bacillota bacterium]
MDMRVMTVEKTGRQERKSFIRLRAQDPLQRRAEWHAWKKLGYRVAESEPGRVDLVDFRSASEDFARHALKKVEVWERKGQKSLFA